MATKGFSKGKGGGGGGGGYGGYGAVRGGNQYQRAAPYYGAGERESAYCAMHGKKRSVECLKMDQATGQYMCTPRNQCKQANSNAGEVETALCSVHQKNRSLMSLEPDAYGGYQCLPSAKCKVSGGPHPHYPVKAPYVPPPAETNDQTGVCIVHHKPRSWSCLQDNGYGTYRCLLTDTCKIKEGQPIAAPHVAPLWGGGGGGGGKGGADSAFCSVHHKKRSMANLQQGYNGLECMPGSECKHGEIGPDGLPEPTPGTSPCSVHGKTRSVTCMMDDGLGGLRCTPEHECK